MSNKESVSKYYDGYVGIQEKIGINSRHFHIIDKLSKSGLKPHHHVLEVGCGIGTVSQLIARKVSRGSVLAVDISEKSIIKARSLWKNINNIHFEVSDMTDFEIKGKTFDFFVFPDVLEHIPVEQHVHLFDKIRQHSHDYSIVFIHIPAPRFLNYNIEYQPHKLQIIDQPLDTATLLLALKNNGYYLDKMETYAVFYEEKDYQYFIFKRDLPLKTSTIRKKWPVFLERMRLKIKTG